MPVSRTPYAPLIIDIAGTALNADDRRRITHPLVGGLIYFSRNWESRAQITALSAEIKSLRPDLLLCIDHEGGRVQRFRQDGFTHLPPMRAFGRRWRDDGGGGPGDGAMRAMDGACAAGYILGTELRACGIDFSFAPVLDLDHGESGVIGDRAFDRDPRVVAALARSVMHGLARAGIQHCGKHFPGHGFVTADSHTDIPVDERSLDAILADDAMPYHWLSASLAAVMPAHVIYPQIDRRPAGFSHRWLHDILRGRLGFEGAIISDDLSMEGARRIDGHTATFAEAALAALAAGCDMALLCNQSLGGGAGVDGLIEGVESAWPRRTGMHDEIREARRRSLLPGAGPRALSEWPVSAAYRKAKSTLAVLA